MPCKANNRQELASLIENNKAIFDILPNQKAEDTLFNLEFTSDNFVKKDGRYTVTDTEAKLGTTVTTKISDIFQKRMPKLKDTKREKYINQTAEIGNTIHETNEAIIKDILNQLGTLNVDMALTAIDNINVDSEGLKKIREKYGYDVNVVVYDKLVSGIKNLLKQIYKRQREINRKTGLKGNVKILPEQIIIDSQHDIGGTADVIAIFSNNDAGIYDFKTKIPSADKKNPDGSLKENAKLLNVGDKEKYAMQLSTIGRILKQRYGVRNIIFGRIVPIRINMKSWNKNEEIYTKSISDVAIGADQDARLEHITSLPEKTGFEDLDKYLTDIEKKIRNYSEKARDNKDKKEEYLNKVSELEKSRDQILHNHNFNNLLDYIKKIHENLTDSEIDKLSFGELRDVINELKTLSAISESTYQYRKALKERGISTDKLESDINALISIVNDKISMLEEILYKEKIAQLIEDYTGISILNSEKEITPFQSEGFFGKYFNQLSEFENPIFKAFRSKLDSIQYDIRSKVNNVIEEVQEKEDALYNWMKRNGKDHAWLIDTLIDKDTDNFKQKRSKDFNNKLKQIKKDGDIDQIIHFYEPNEYYQEWYDRVRSTITNSESLQRFDENFNLAKDKSGNPIYPNAWLQQLSNGRLRVKKEIDQKNISKDYDYIHSIPELANYYEMFVKYNQEFRDKLGVQYFKLPDNFVPNIRKQTIDRVLEFGLVKGISSSVNDFIESFDVRQDDMFFGDIEDGELKKRIPRFFINPFKDKDDNVAIGEKSYEFGKSLIIFAKMAYNYEMMTREEAEILGLKEFIMERAQEYIKRRGKNVEDFVGNKLVTNLVNTDMKDIFSAFVDMYLYGVHVQPKLGDKSGDWEKRILLAKQYFTLKSLGLNWIAASGSLIAAKTASAIEGFKGIIYDKTQYKEAITDAYKNRHKFLAINAFFDPMAVRFENFSVSKEKEYGHTQVGKPTERNFIKKYVTTRTLLRPFSYGDEMIDETILVAMSKNYYVDNNGNLRRFRNENEKKEFANRSIWNLFSYENEDAKLNIPEEQLKNVIIPFRRAVQGGQSKIKGTIPEEDKAYWQSQILGQVVMHFKSWMPGILKERFGKLRYNDNIQSIDMGRYTAFGQEFFNAEQLGAVDFISKIVAPKLGEFALRLLWLSKSKFNDKARKLEAFNKFLEENPHYEGKITFEEFEDLQQKQVKALLVELRIVLALAGLMLMLGADWDDDGEADYKKYYAAKVAMAAIYKTNQELTFVFNPTEFASMIKNPIPMIGLVTSAQKTLYNTLDETRDIMLGENSNKDKTIPFYYLHQWIPGAYGMSKLLGIFDNEPERLYK